MLCTDWRVECPDGHAHQGCDVGGWQRYTTHRQTTQDEHEGIDLDRGAVHEIQRAYLQHVSHHRRALLCRENWQQHRVGGMGGGVGGEWWFVDVISCAMLTSNRDWMMMTTRRRRSHWEAGLQI